MRQRIALGGVSVAAMLGLLLVWAMSSTRPVSAMEKMAEEVRKAKSYKCTAIGKMSFVIKLGDSTKETTKEVKMTHYWLAPFSVRMDTTDSGTWKGPGPEQSNIVPGLNKPWIMINNRNKTFRFQMPSVDLLKEAASPLARLENFGTFSGNADRELGTKEINGRKARGFVIDTKKIDPDCPPQMMEIWIDSETNLPVLLHCDRKTESSSMTLEVSDIQWNIDLDPKLFDATPPEGYKDDTPITPASAEQARQISQALRIFAELNGGHYPQRLLDGGGFRELLTLMEKVGITKREGGVPTFKIDSEQAAKAVKAMGQLLDVKVGPDVAYYGKTVGPKDKDKVLLRWKLDDGRYQVIFGDLRAETVTAERLRALEGK